MGETLAKVPGLLFSYSGTASTEKLGEPPPHRIPHSPVVRALARGVADPPFKPIVPLLAGRGESKPSFPGECAYHWAKAYKAGAYSCHLVWGEAEAWFLPTDI